MKNIKKIVGFLLTVTLVSFGLALATAQLVGASSAWAPRDDCGYTIQRGDTLNEISGRTGVSVDDHVAVNPSITNKHMIIAGATMDICHPAVVRGDRPVLVTQHPGEILRWARVVELSRPAWATDANVRFLVAVSGPESLHGTDIWNPGDASPRYTGSYGVVQIRILRRPDLHPDDWFRDREWLQVSFRRQARAAWMLWEQRVERGQTGESAWGPHRDGKLPFNCTRSINRTQCRTWWAQADAAIAAV